MDDSNTYSQPFYYPSNDSTATTTTTASHFHPYQSQFSLTHEHQSKALVPTVDPKKCSCTVLLHRSIVELCLFLGNELEVTGNVRNLSPILWTLSQLTVLYLNDNQLTRLPSEIACLTNLVTLDLSNNKLRNLPAEIGKTM